MNIKEQIIENLKQILTGMGVEDPKIELETPTDLLHGDYSTNLALRIAKQVGKPPMDLAEEIAKKLSMPEIERVEVVKPGFINFWVSKNTILNLIDPEKENLKSSNLKNQKVMVEFTDPNPFKEFHIGHLYSNAVGESLSRLLESQGARVWRANFFGDVGMHTAKAIFGLRQKIKDEGLKIEDLEKKTLKERAEYLGQAYAFGSKKFDESDEVKDEVKRLNLLIFVAAQKHWQEEAGWKPRVDYRKHVKEIDEKELKEIQTLWVTGRRWSLEYFETIYKRLGTKFDGYYPESLTGEWGYDFVLEGLKRGVFEESDGAVVYKGEKHGLHTRVFINKLGLPTYETKDIGNAPHKYSEFEYDKSIIVTGKEIDEYFKVVIAAMNEVNPALGAKTQHVGHGMVRLPSGKMSSRSGSVITAEWLLDEAKKRILEAYPKMEDSTAEKVTVAAVKFALLRVAIGRDIEFSFEESISFEGNSGPYIQYTYARTQSVLSKSTDYGPQTTEKHSAVDGRQWTVDQLEIGEEKLLRLLFKFSEIVEKAVEDYSPHVLCQYLFSLAQQFNLFYQKHRIVGSTEEKFRLELVKSVGETLKQGLNLLGVQAPERM